MTDIGTHVMECRHCTELVYVPEGDWFEYDGEIVVDRLDSLCPEHRANVLDGMDRAREYSGDVPPSWFDPTYAGEEW